VDLNSSGGKSPSPGIGIYGCGAVGSALARAFKRAGYQLTACIDKRASVARKLAEELSVSFYTSSPQDLGHDTQVLIIAVPDSQLKSVDRSLVRIIPDSELQLCAHTSGALPGSILELTSGLGISVGSIHPLQTFPSADQSPDLEGAYFAIEGHVDAVILLEALVVRIGGIPMKLPEARKALYHAAAVFSSNFLPVLQRTALDLLFAVDIPPTQGRKMLEPLMRQSLENCLQRGEAEALTGPVARGDAITIEKHRKAIKNISPAAESLYRILSLMALELAVEKGLDDVSLEKVHMVLDN
jgi:predicted short-subunit dehydrogenase-like oxidoreductase (DUF2520 family)